MRVACTRSDGAAEVIGSGENDMGLGVTDL